MVGNKYKKELLKDKVFYLETLKILFDKPKNSIHDELIETLKTNIKNINNRLTKIQ